VTGYSFLELVCVYLGTLEYELTVSKDNSTTSADDVTINNELSLNTELNIIKTV